MTLAIDQARNSFGMVGISSRVTRAVAYCCLFFSFYKSFVTPFQLHRTPGFYFKLTTSPTGTLYVAHVVEMLLSTSDGSIVRIISRIISQH